MGCTRAAAGVDPGTRAGGEAVRASVARELRRTVAEIQRWTQRWLHRRTGTTLSPNETHLLGHLDTAGPQRMSGLAAWQNVDKSTMTMQIKSLVERGFVERAASQLLRTGRGSRAEAFGSPQAGIRPTVSSELQKMLGIVF